MNHYNDKSTILLIRKANYKLDWVMRNNRRILHGVWASDTFIPGQSALQTGHCEVCECGEQAEAIQQMQISTRNQGQATNTIGLRVNICHIKMI